MNSLNKKLQIELQSIKDNGLYKNERQIVSPQETEIKVSELSVKSALVKSTLKDHPYVRSFTWAFSLPKLPPLYFNRWALFDHMIELVF